MDLGVFYLSSWSEGHGWKNPFHDLKFSNIIFISQTEASSEDFRFLEYIKHSNE